MALSARNRSALEDVARECPGGRAIVVPLDVTDLRANLEATGRIASELGGIDIAFLNAGTCEYIDARHFDAALCERVMRANFVGLANGIEAVLPVLRNSPHAQLVGMSSTVAFGPLPRAEAYGASKAAIRYLMESLRIDLRGEPISITVVCPGFVKTPLTDRNDFPMPFLIGAEDAARIIVDGVAAPPTRNRFSQAPQHSIQSRSDAADAALHSARRTNHRALMKIAIVGTGIAGMTAAWHLHRNHDITVFEAADYIGGHTNTVDVVHDGVEYAIDTGFIVFNNKTYPEFVRLMNLLHVPSQPTEMSFSVRCEATGLEYNGASLNKLFAQRRNLLRPSFHRMLLDILRFYREAPRLLADESSPGPSLGEYLETNRYSAEFINRHIMPLGAAVWSTDPRALFDFPAAVFLRFFHNHGLLQMRNRPQWRVISGGSARYVEKLTAPFRDRIRLNSPVESIRRTARHVDVRARGTWERFDTIVIASHGDQALRMLSDPTAREREIVGSFRTQRNVAYCIPTTPSCRAAAVSSAAFAPSATSRYCIPTIPSCRAAAVHGPHGTITCSASTSSRSRSPTT